MTGATVVTASAATSSVVIASAASGLVGGYTGAFLNSTGQNRLAGKSWSESLAAGHQLESPELWELRPAQPDPNSSGFGPNDYV